MRYQIVGFTLGILIVLQGLAQMIPALVDFAGGHANASAFFMGGMISVFFGGALVLSCPPDKRGIGVRQAFLLTALSWITISVFAAIPFCLSDIQVSFTDAFFETVSGFTTTGSTVFVGLDNMSHGILLWRAIMQLFGGIGMVAFAVVFLPFLRVGGMQLLQTESSDRSDKIMPRVREVTWALLIVYIGLNAACAVVYKTLGMSWFDAICHAFPTVATGGMSTHDASFGYFNSYTIDMTAVVFMIAGGLPFVLFINLLYNGKFDFFKDEQFKAFIGLLAVVIGVLTLWLWGNSDYSLAQSFRYVSFNITSVITTTGFATTDYLQWGPFATIIFLFVTYLGACAGSTAGGIKTMRLVIIARAVGKQIKMLIYPRGVFAMYYQGRPVSGNVVQTVLGFLCLYVVTNVILTMALALTGLDFATSLSGAATAIANVGPGIGPIIGPAGNFSSLPDIAKWLLSAGMLLGRLEILTFAVLFTPGFWKS
jgi:trk system potassium uptake protein TrkH